MVNHCSPSIAWKSPIIGTILLTTFHIQGFPIVVGSPISSLGSPIIGAVQLTLLPTFLKQVGTNYIADPSRHPADRGVVKHGSPNVTLVPPSSAPSR
jgi:hypothetical protein